MTPPKTIDADRLTELRNQFTKETGEERINSQGEPDIDYVDWLENKILSLSIPISHEGGREECHEAGCNELAICGNYCGSHCKCKA